MTDEINRSYLALLKGAIDKAYTDAVRPSPYVEGRTADVRMFLPEKLKDHLAAAILRKMGFRVIAP